MQPSLLNLLTDLQVSSEERPENGDEIAIVILKALSQSTPFPVQRLELVKQRSTPCVWSTSLASSGKNVAEFLRVLGEIAVVQIIADLKPVPEHRHRNRPRRELVLLSAKLRDNNGDYYGYEEP
nr:hypothetical protein Ccrd_003801 [Ipomoea batatas]